MRNYLPLKELQHKLLGLIKGSYCPKSDDDAYLRTVHGSENLELFKVIVLWSQQSHIERCCFFTSQILIETNQLQTFTAQYFKINSHSSSAYEIADGFLQWVIQNGKGLVKLVARFEYAMIQLQKGNIYSDELIWPYDPSIVLQGLTDGNFSALFLESGEYRMTLSNGLDGHFEVEVFRKNDAPFRYPASVSNF